MAKQAMDLCIIILLSGFVGARLGHVFFEAPELYFQSPLRFFYFWEGGFVFYTGALISILTSLIYFKTKKIKTLDVLKWFDFFAPVIALGYGLGRFACLTAGCCYGKICNLPWAIQIPNVDGWPSLIHRHPTPLYASLIELLFIFPVVFFISKVKHKPGTVFFLWLALHSISRLIMEFFRDDFRGPFYLGLSISSWFSILFIILSVYFKVYFKNRFAEINSGT
jgi:phosphatidylglycerol:prolipoprotein diacylglycerol transferase